MSATLSKIIRSAFEEVEEDIMGGIRFTLTSEATEFDLYDQLTQAIRLFLTHNFRKAIDKGEHIYKVEISFDQKGNAESSFWIRDNKNASALRYVVVRDTELEEDRFVDEGPDRMEEGDK